MKYYTLAAKQGSVDAQYNLGYLYQKSTHIKFNYRKAFHWYSLSTKGGNIAAQNCLGYLYEKGLGTDIDYQKALYWYTKAANAGYSKAQVTLGKWYRKGQHVSQDCIQAAHWYKLAAKQGNQVAQNCLDLLYQNGKIDGTTNEEESFMYSTGPSRKNRLSSRLRLDIGKLSSSFQRNQLERMAMNALKGDENAMYKIGQMYYNGEYFMKDEDISFKWILNAANAGNKDAQFKIAEMYENGDTIEQNYHKMSIWVENLAKEKNDVAQYKLGILYKEGLGVRKNPLESSKWIIFSADQGNADAMYEFGFLKANGIVYKKDTQEAIKWYYKSAIRGNLNACYAFGMPYLLGDNVKPDVNKATRALIYAARHCHSLSQYTLGKIYDEGKIISQDLLKSNEYYSMTTGPLKFFCLYDITKNYLNRLSTFENNIKLFSFFKKMAEKNHIFAPKIFELPIQVYYDKIDYSRLIEVFRDASVAGIANLELNIGYMYENGVYTKIMEEPFAIEFESTMYWYAISARKGDSRADYRLGIMYELGKGVTKDMTTAIEYYKKSAYNNNNDARYRLACFYLVGHTLPKDIARAYHLFKEAADMGHRESRKALMLSDNTKEEDSIINNLHPEVLTIINEKNQISMLETMAESGLVAVQYQLGKMYQDNGDSKAIKWLTLAAQGGISDACYRLGVLYEEGRGAPRNYSLAKDLYEKAAQSDHESAIYRLAQMYQFGKGTRIRYMEAYYLHLRASEMGHGLSLKTINITGDLHKNSVTNEFETSSKDYKQSLSMCEYVAEQGNVDLQFRLGVVYEWRLCEPDYSKAFKWYQMASLSHHKEAIYRLGLLYEKGLGVAQCYPKAVQLFVQAKNLENSDSIYKLAVAYQSGHGVEIDSKKSVEYYILAAKLDNPLSKYTLGTLYETGILAEKNILESLKWYTRAYLTGCDAARSNLFGMYDGDSYDDFYYKKLLPILQRISVKIEEGSLDYVDYSIFNKLGFYYYQDGNVNKAWEYFEKWLPNVVIKIKLSFLNCNFITSKEKKDILNQLLLDKPLMNRLKGNTLYNLGMIYYRGRVEELGYGKAKKKEEWVNPARNEEISDTPDTIIKQDYSKALVFLKKAAEKNSGEAQYQIGAMYHHGYGVDKNIQEAIDWYTKAEQNGVAESSEILGNLYHCDGELQDFSNALKHYKKDSCLKAYIGLLYHYGTGIEQSYEKALECYLSSNNRYYHERFRSFYLGLIYYDSHNSSQDYEKAFHLFQRIERVPSSSAKFILVRPSIIADINQTTNKYTYTLEPENVFRGVAYYYLGIMCKNGQGTLQDDQKATQCFLKAVELGNELVKQFIK